MWLKPYMQVRIAPLENEFEFIRGEMGNGTNTEESGKAQRLPIKG